MGLRKKLGQLAASGLRKKLGQLAASLELLERKDRFLKAVVSEIGGLLLEATGRCRECEGWIEVEGAPPPPSMPCSACTHARERLEVFAAGMQALLDEEAALVARFGGRPVRPLTRHCDPLALRGVLSYWRGRGSA